jgi:hypothetical protein
MMKMMTGESSSTAGQDLIDNDHRQAIVVGHQDPVFVEENAANVKTVGDHGLLELRDPAREQLKDPFPFDFD